ncbi:MAG: hypothetical protein Kow0010_13910 [Dehalococcoidia bacterium]
MSDWRDAVERAREEARRAREEALRAREEARRLRREARAAERQARREQRGKTLDGEEEIADGATVERALDFDGVRELVIDQTAGSLFVRRCDDGETPGLVATSSRTPPEVNVVRDGARLRVEVLLPRGWLFRRRRGARTTVRIAGELTTVRADLGYGDLQLEQVQADRILAHVGAGELRGYGTSGDLDADVGAGKISISNHAGLARCNSGTGDVVVDVAQAREGEYRLEVGMGRVELRLPEGERVHARMSSGIGKRAQEYPDAGEDAPIQARLSTGIGEASLKARRAGSEPVKPRRTTGGGAQSPSRRRYEAEELRILQLLEQGRITSQEAAELIAALQGAPPPDDEFSFPGDDEPHPADDVAKD